MNVSSAGVTIAELSARILARLPSMSRQLALGGRFLIDNPEQVAISSMREIATRLKVAPATLVRLARALEFEDWSGLRNAYVAPFKSAPNYADKADEIVRRQGAPGLIEEVRRAQSAALEHAESSNSADTVDEAAKILNRAPRIFVAGFMSCRTPALAFSYICRLFRSNVSLLGVDGSSLAADLADLRSDDCVLSISFSPYSADTNRIAAAVEKSGATLIAITDSRVMPLSNLAKLMLYFRAQSPSFFPSVMTAVALVESLAAAMLAHAGNDAANRVGEIEAALYASGAYVINPMPQ